VDDVLGVEEREDGDSIPLAGARGMWLDSFTRDHGRMRLSDRRVLGAAETGADTRSIACPYEVSGFEDAVKATGHEGRLEVRDIAALRAAAMRRP